MKKILFSVIAMVAFTSTMSAQNDVQDSTVCLDLMNKYKSGLRNEGKTPAEISRYANIYYVGCIDGRKADRKNLQRQQNTLSGN